MQLFKNKGVDKMHTPDGFLTNWVCVVTLIISLVAITVAVISSRKWLTKQKAFLMAGLAAAIFGFQMLNFPIGDGTSGHLIGGAMVAILLGPHAAVLVLAVVLSIQAFVYGDGGVLALGANIFNMGIVAGYTAYYTYKPLKKKFLMLSGVFASFCSVVAASISCAFLLGISGTILFVKVIPAMVLTHIFIGLGEGIITGGILLYIKRTKHELLDRREVPNLMKYVAVSFMLAFLVTAFALPFASGDPDGLEQVALRLGFFEKATEIYTLSPMPDYTFLGQERYLFVLIAGIIGMIMSFGLGYFVTKPLAIKT
jgi:cobalt/nickel transport system permease protein